MEQPAFHIRSSIRTYNEDWYDVGFHQNLTLEIEIVLEEAAGQLARGFG
jgi:hypothetical protein